MPRSEDVISFAAARESLGTLDPETTARLLTAAADVALVVDEDGVIQDIAFSSDDLARDLGAAEPLRGRLWADTVAEDSRAKVIELIREARPDEATRWRHVNHIGAGGTAVPVMFSAIKVADAPRAVAFGRDLRPLSALQQRLVEAQASMERDYSRLRQAETRYRLLFQTATEPVLILDATSGRIVEANPAAASLARDKRLVGTPFADLLDPASRDTLVALVAQVRATGRGDDITVRLATDQRAVRLSATLFRQDGSLLVLVRLSDAPSAEAGLVLPQDKTKLLKLVERAPDAFVVTETDGRVITANAAFLDMTQVAAEEQVRGQSLERWLGRSAVDLDVLLATLRGGAPVRLFATQLRGELGATTEVEISAVSLVNGGKPCFGFAIRDVGRRFAPAQATQTPVTRSVEQLTELIGRVPLKDLVREATDVIERLCIEAALELTNDNRASAAEMLGLSRQSLYVKLRRYGLVGPEDGGEG
ncbi:transcriptional regulator PpsR [Elioraea thermophila]|uniref:transcriptional regulator PpsR n=1 Tax=Elioraea thermophila TaxID=2185104 RepID=UPI0018E4FB01|nr:transcriptional regulator PpsR [Elioraea thermophila]